MQWFRKKVQFSCLQSMHICCVQDNDNLVHATIRRARCRMAIPHDDLCGFSCDRSKVSRSLRRSVTLFARFNLRRANYHVSYDNPLRYSLASYHTGISTNWDFAGSQDGPWKKEKNHLYGGTLERAWVLPRYDAIMRYEHRRGSGEGEKGGSNWWEKERRRESNARTRKKETGRGDGERWTEGDGWSCRTDLD